LPGSDATAFALNPDERAGDCAHDELTNDDAATTGLFESVVAPELVEQRKELLDRDKGQ